MHLLDVKNKIHADQEEIEELTPELSLDLGNNKILESPLDSTVIYLRDNGAEPPVSIYVTTDQAAQIMVKLQQWLTND